MDPAYAAAYRDLYERHWWWRARERFLLDRLEAASGGRTDLRILDVGCGDALFFDELQMFGGVTGIETDASFLSDGRWRSRIHTEPLDEAWARSHTFDWILMLDVLEHVEEADALLSAARTTLASGGRLFITVPALPALWTYHDELNHHFRRYTRTSLHAAMIRARLEPLELRYFFHWLAPLKLLVRCREAIVPRKSGSIERVPAPALNGMAYAVSRVEQIIPGSGRIPFGTSLYACCTPA
jgi:SAM-dependent methyltransferase